MRFGVVGSFLVCLFFSWDSFGSVEQLTHAPIKQNSPKQNSPRLQEAQTTLNSELGKIVINIPFVNIQHDSRPREHVINYLKALDQLDDSVVFELHGRPIIRSMLELSQKTVDIQFPYLCNDSAQSKNPELPFTVGQQKLGATIYGLFSLESHPVNVDHVKKPTFTFDAHRLKPLEKYFSEIDIRNLSQEKRIFSNKESYLRATKSRLNRSLTDPEKAVLMSNAFAFDIEVDIHISNHLKNHIPFGKYKDVKMALRKLASNRIDALIAPVNTVEPSLIELEMGNLKIQRKFFSSQDFCHISTNDDRGRRISNYIDTLIEVSFSNGLHREHIFPLYETVQKWVKKYAPEKAHLFPGLRYE